MSDYDRAITVFSPDGHLLQVQYASEAAGRGLSTIAVKGKDCVVIAVERKLGLKLQDGTIVKKIEVINDSLAIAFAGLSADGRSLINKARIEAQNHKLASGEEPGIDYIAKFIAKLQQKYTIKGGMRPFGIACLICGYDQENRPCLYKSEPHGILVGWKAHAIGRYEKVINEFFEKYYKDNMSEDECISFILGAMSHAMDCTSQNVEIAVVSKNNEQKNINNKLAKYFRYLTKDEFANITPFKPGEVC